MTEDAFLRSILADPDDDTVRLIYADWLTEHGDPRGDFIRLQIALSRLPANDPGRAEMEARETELLAEHEEEWLQPLDALLPPADCAPVLVRGLVGEITFYGSAGAERFVRDAGVLFARLPLQVVRFSPCGGHGFKLFPWDRPKLDYDRIDSRTLWRLTELPELPRLRGLDLGGSTLDGEDGTTFSVGNAIGNAGAERLASATGLANLRTLILTDNLIGRAGAGSSTLNALTCLDLRFNNLDAPAIEALRRRHGKALVV